MEQKDDLGELVERLDSVLDALKVANDAATLTAWISTGIATVGAGSECFANRCEATETLACDVPLNVASFPVEGRLLVL